MAGAVLHDMSPPKMDDAMDKAPEADDDKEGLRAVARSIMDAMKADDEHAMAMAMMDFIDMAKDMDIDEDMDAEEAEPMPMLE